MSQPSLLQTYPADEDIGIPVGITIQLYFDRGIDLLTAKNSIVLYGPDFDQTSGPDTALWIDQDTGNNPFFLRSPGFSGLVECTYELAYANTTSFVEEDPGVITSELDEVAAEVGHIVKVTPVNGLAADSEYHLHVLGDPDSLNRGISSRTVFDLEADPGNSSTIGVVSVTGSYTGSADTVVIEITTGGDVNTAKYRWYYQTLGVGSAIAGCVTNRRYRNLSKGLQVKFSGSAFAAGDTFTFNVEAAERLAENYHIHFTTNDGSYSEAPDSPSTPAESSPPSSILPIAPGALVEDTTFYVIESDPEALSFNNANSLRTFTITFSEDLDPDSITNSTVRVWRQPLLGVNCNTPRKLELVKNLVVEDNILTIEI